MWETIKGATTDDATNQFQRIGCACNIRTIWIVVRGTKSAVIDITWPEIAVIDVLTFRWNAIWQIFEETIDIPTIWNVVFCLKTVQKLHSSMLELSTDYATNQFQLLKFAVFFLSRLNFEDFLCSAVLFACMKYVAPKIIQWIQFISTIEIQRFFCSVVVHLMSWNICTSWNICASFIICTSWNICTLYFHYLHVMEYLHVILYLHVVVYLYVIVFFVFTKCNLAEITFISTWFRLFIFRNDIFACHGIFARHWIFARHCIFARHRIFVRHGIFARF